MEGWVRCDLVGVLDAIAVPRSFLIGGKVKPSPKCWAYLFRVFGILLFAHGGVEQRTGPPQFVNLP